MTLTRPFDTSVMPNSATSMFDSKTLAKALGVQPATIKTMRSRGQLPEPTATVGNSLVWSKELVYDFFGVWPKVGETRLPGVPPVDPALPKVVDLFSGCGGMSLGFQKAGFDVLVGYDNWPCAVDTYRANMGHGAELLDLGDVPMVLETLAPLFEGINSPAIIGGPPCQDFSSAGKRTEGARADLTEKYAAIVSYFQPPFFVMENVARAERSGAFKRAVATMEQAGYRVKFLVVDASKVGVPQVRKRLITVGTHDEQTTWSIFDALLLGQSLVSMTIRQYFEGVLGCDLDTDFYYRHPRSYARRGVFSVDEPSPTVRGVNRPIPAGYPGHKGDAAPVDCARPLTTAERALIQTFPPEFSWVGSRTNVEQMIGNAVPVSLGQFIGKAIAEAMREHW